MVSISIGSEVATSSDGRWSCKGEDVYVYNARDLPAFYSTSPLPVMRNDNHWPPSSVKKYIFKASCNEFGQVTYKTKFNHSGLVVFLTVRQSIERNGEYQKGLFFRFSQFIPPSSREGSHSFVKVKVPLDFVLAKLQ